MEISSTAHGPPREGVAGMSRVCVDRCVQDPQQVVTRNREGCGTDWWLPIRQELCVPSWAPSSVVGVADVSVVLEKKSALFFPLSFHPGLAPWKRHTTLPPPIHHRSKPRSILVAVASRRVSTIETMASLIKISFRERFPAFHPSSIFYPLPFVFGEAMVFSRHHLFPRELSVKYIRVSRGCWKLLELIEVRWFFQWWVLNDVLDWKWINQRVIR